LGLRGGRVVRECDHEFGGGNELTAGMDAVWLATACIGGGQGVRCVVGSGITETKKNKNYTESTQLTGEHRAHREETEEENGLRS